MKSLDKNKSTEGKGIKIIKELIIWLFEKYAYDYWVEKAEIESDKSEMKRYGVETIEELREIQISEQREPAQEAYQQGKADGYNECAKDYNL